MAMHEPTWHSPKSGPQWRPNLQAYAYPIIGELPVSEITPSHVMTSSSKHSLARSIEG